MNQTPTRRMTTGSDPLPRTVSLEIPARTVAKTLSIIAIFLLGALFVMKIVSVIIALVIAVFFAVAADPAVRFLQRKGLSRGKAVAVFFAILLVVVAGLAAVFVPPLIDQAENLVDNAPSYVREVRENETFRNLDERFGIVERLANEAEDLPALVSREVADVAGTVASSLFAAFTVIFLMILLLLRGSGLVNTAAKVFPQLTERRSWGIVQDAYRSVGGYVSGVLVIATIAGLSILVLEVILGIPSPLPLALWMTVFVPIPLVGSTIGAIPVAIVAFVSEGVVDGIIVIAFIIVYQQIENAVLQPSILGKFVQLSPIVVFVSVLTGAQLLGILGALLAIPVAGILQILFREWLEDRGTAQDVDLPDITSDDGQPLFSPASQPHPPKDQG